MPMPGGPPQPPQVVPAQGLQIQMVNLGGVQPAVGFMFNVNGQGVVMCCSPDWEWEHLAATLIRAADAARAQVAAAVAPEPEEPAEPVEARCWSCNSRIFGPLVGTGGCAVHGPNPEWPTLDDAVAEDGPPEQVEP
jgi:hypothetical protein